MIRSFHKRVLAFFDIDALSGTAVSGRGFRAFAELFVKAAQIVVADVGRNFDYLFALHQFVGRLGHSQPVQVIAWTHFVIAFELT